MSVLGSKEIRRRILEERLVENYIDLDVQIQPAGFDLTVDNVYEFDRGGVIDFDNSDRYIPKMNPIPPLDSKKKPYWILKPGAYVITLNEKITLPLDLMGDSMYRSSLMRCGVFTGLGRWDPGYSGVGCSLLVVNNPYGFWLFKNARIAQIKFCRVEGVEQGYVGQYQNEGVKK